MRAVAYCVTTHSNRFGDQMPTRSPRLDAAGEQAARHERDLVPELAVRCPVALMRDHERFAIAVARDGSPEVLADRLAEQRE